MKKPLRLACLAGIVVLLLATAVLLLPRNKVAGVDVYVENLFAHENIGGQMVADNTPDGIIVTVRAVAGGSPLDTPITIRVYDCWGALLCSRSETEGGNITELVVSILYSEMGISPTLDPTGYHIVGWQIPENILNTDGKVEVSAYCLGMPFQGYTTFTFK